VYSDLPIIHSFPGGHRAVINISIANQLLGQQEESLGTDQVTDKVAATSDKFTPRYNKESKKLSLVENIQQSATKYDFAGCC
jgi:hypothetical protein